MLKLPPNIDAKTKQIKRYPEMESLYNKLNELDSTPNAITLDTFRQFEPLFQKNNNLNDLQINELTKKYGELIDFYKETHIVVSATDHRIILTLPAIFTPVRSLSMTERNSTLVAKNQALSHNTVPKYSTDAFANMFNAVQEEQLKNTPVVEQYRKKYIADVQKFFETYKQASEQKIPNEALHDTDGDQLITEGTTWDFED